VSQITIHIPDNVKVRSVTLHVVERHQEHNPRKTERREIGDLRCGEIAYTTPWALAKFGAGKMGINKKYVADPQPGGTVSMKIQKRGKVILVQRDTIRTEYISHWGWDQCIPVKLVNEISDHCKKVFIIFL
jgi:hypothetical protein